MAEDSRGGQPIQIVNGRGALYTKRLTDGRIIDVMPQIFNYLLTISKDAEALTYEDEY